MYYIFSKFAQFRPKNVRYYFPKTIFVVMHLHVLDVPLKEKRSQDTAEISPYLKHPLLIKGILSG